MVNQGIQKHNPDSVDIDGGYCTRPSSPIDLEDDVFDTALSPEFHIIEEDSESSCSTEYNGNIDESDGEDTLNVLYETHQNERDLLGGYIDKLESENFPGTINRVQPYVTMYQQVDESMQESTLRASRKRKWQQINTLNSN
ncbi:hypothetical protein HC358_01530 [Wolbachia pipientis]|uniref:Uncharacterized protein n=1 Tax=Wolbachia pipientis TaxID=955 RepID=A0A7G5C9C0_WOLPI|nr:hypothetical protein [Wolbachia pipientis]QMV45804.1 hypothetical protein HC358_01530 [Wolbachia pipientis]